MLHFLLGYSVFRVVDARSLAVGCFFALAFSAGHLIHEVRDLEGDRRNGIGTARAAPVVASAFRRKAQCLAGGFAARAAARAASSSCSVGNRSNLRSVGFARRWLSKKSSMAVQSSGVNA